MHKYKFFQNCTGFYNIIVHFWIQKLIIQEVTKVNYLKF